ncbi:hypothetical protein L3Y34_015926 [Caenorhabditis briggsae]|uniref:Uncharacterized protein n=1 Tax=Caenorhabditis briggsae TaxID=6238 RepID=A0AAE9DXN3_CAEBR|nr:hypothetical protein L3Y34_015926 [Caenorhabditis briggsae]
MKLCFLLLNFVILVSANFRFNLKTIGTKKFNLVDELNRFALETNATSSKYKNDIRRQIGEMDLEPPDSYSKIVNLFYGRMLHLIESNSESDIDTIAKYTNAETQILLCERSQKSTFAELKRFIQLLYLYFKQVKQVTYSMQPQSNNSVKFQVKYKATTVRNTEVEQEWHGEAYYDSNLKYYIYSTLDLKRDCASLPNEIPEHPVEPKEAYINRLKSNLTEILFKNPNVPESTYQTFIQQFMIDRTQMQFCERNGETGGRYTLSDFLFKRYADLDTFTDHAFSISQFSDYQTDVTFTVLGTWKNGIILKDTYRFRVEEARERNGDQGWMDWWTTWVFVECSVNLTPKTDPEYLKKVFMQQVCFSIPPMIQFGPSVQSRTTFLSHFMEGEEQGFHAQICEQNYKPIYDFSQFEKWLASWVLEYDGSKLAEAKIDSFENFLFTCVVDVMKNYGDHDKEWKKREFTMKAYFEVDRWLVKEAKIGFTILYQFEHSVSIRIINPFGTLDLDMVKPKPKSKSNDKNADKSCKSKKFSLMRSIRSLSGRKKAAKKKAENYQNKAPVGSSASV